MENKLPRESDLEKIGQELYDEIGTEKRLYDINKVKAASMGFDTTSIGSGICVHGPRAYNGYYGARYDNRTITTNPVSVFTGGGCGSRGYAICIGD